MFRQRQRRTAASTSRITTMGGSMAQSRVRPRSVHSTRSESTRQRSRCAVASRAAAGPVTFAQGCSLPASFVRARARHIANVRTGSHSNHMACAHMPMTDLCASNAGSARPDSEPSANHNARSRFWPQVPAAGAVEAATARRCSTRVEADTPRCPWPKVSAAVPPVRAKRAVFTSARRSAPKRGRRRRKSLRRR